MISDRLKKDETHISEKIKHFNALARNILSEAEKKSYDLFREATLLKTPRRKYRSAKNIFPPLYKFPNCHNTQNYKFF